MSKTQDYHFQLISVAVSFERAFLLGLPLCAFSVPRGKTSGMDVGNGLQRVHGRQGTRHAITTMLYVVVNQTA